MMSRIARKEGVAHAHPDLRSPFERLRMRGCSAQSVGALVARSPQYVPLAIDCDSLDVELFPKSLSGLWGRAWYPPFSEGA